MVAPILDLTPVAEAMCRALADAAWPYPYEQGPREAQEMLQAQVRMMLLPAVDPMVQTVATYLQRQGWLPPVADGLGLATHVV